MSDTASHDERDQSFKIAIESADKKIRAGKIRGLFLKGLLALTATGFVGTLVNSGRAGEAEAKAFEKYLESKRLSFDSTSRALDADQDLSVKRRMSRMLGDDSSEIDAAIKEAEQAFAVARQNNLTAINAGSEAITIHKEAIENKITAERFNAAALAALLVSLVGLAVNSVKKEEHENEREKLVKIRKLQSTLPGADAPTFNSLTPEERRITRIVLQYLVRPSADKSLLDEGQLSQAFGPAFIAAAKKSLGDEDFVDPKSADVLELAAKNKVLTSVIHLAAENSRSLE